MSFTLKKSEREALDKAAAMFVQWRRDWYDAGVTVNLSDLAAVRKAARAFHKALAPLLGPDAINGTRARLLVRMQQKRLHQRHQDDHYRQLTEAYATALLVDDACSVDVKQGVKKSRLIYVWIFHAADQWPGDAPTATGRFGAALLEYASPVPIGSMERIDDALATWREQRNGK